MDLGKTAWLALCLLSPVKYSVLASCCNWRCVKPVHDKIKTKQRAERVQPGWWCWNRSGGDIRQVSLPFVGPLWCHNGPASTPVCLCVNMHSLKSGSSHRSEQRAFLSLDSRRWLTQDRETHYCLWNINRLVFNTLLLGFPLAVICISYLLG